MSIAWAAAHLTTWGRSRYADVQAAAPSEDRAVAQALAGHVGSRGLIAYGSGRCYGDAALNDRGQALLTRKLRGILAFNPATREAMVEGGVSFDDLAAHFHPLGFSFAVSSATGAVTVGGAVANDIHSKNHPSAGSFGRHVRWIDLMLADGSVVRASRTEHEEIFRATLGGLGLTGIVLRVGLTMVPIPSRAAAASYKSMPNIDAFLDEIEDANLRSPFWFGWIDALASGASLGRGILETGDYAASDEGMAPMPKRFVFRAPFPVLLLHPAIIARYNERRYRKLPRAGVQVKWPLEKFFFPLDHLVHFNRVYGRRGFYSIHCGIPYGDRRTVRRVIEEISKARAGSLASVLKPLGGPGEGLLSFPLKGYALAVDLPRRPGVEDLHRTLERIVLEAGGRLYAAKDALMSAEGFARMFPELDRFRAVLREVDPRSRFQSDMSRRLRIRG